MYVLDKYEPKQLDELLCKDGVKAIEEWYLRGHKQPLLLSGPSGIGKSTIVRLFAQKHKFTLYELTPSDARDKDSLEKQTSVVSKSQSIFSQKNLLFFDNIDVFFGEDKGGLELVLKIAKDAANPVVFVANDLYADKKMQKVRELSETVALKRPNYLSISVLLKKICLDYKIKYDEGTIKQIAQDCDGDIRSAILDLDTISFYGVQASNLKLLGKRERKQDVFKTVIGLFKAHTLKEAFEIRDASELDFDMLYNWIVENLPAFYEKENLKEAYELVSKGDINRSRIYVRQNWVFLKYFIVLGIIGPAIYPTKDNFSYKITFPAFIKMMSRETSIFSKNTKAANLLKMMLRGSKRRVISELEYYKKIFSDKNMFVELTKHASQEEQEFIVEFFELPKNFLKLNPNNSELFEEEYEKKTERKHREKKDEKDDVKKNVKEEEKQNENTKEDIKHEKHEQNKEKNPKPTKDFEEKKKQSTLHNFFKSK